MSKSSIKRSVYPKILFHILLGLTLILSGFTSPLYAQTPSKLQILLPGM